MLPIYNYNRENKVVFYGYEKNISSYLRGIFGFVLALNLCDDNFYLQNAILHIK